MTASAGRAEVVVARLEPGLGTFFYGPFTHAEFRARLLDPDSAQKIVAYGASRDGDPIALAVAEPRPHEATFDLRSLFVTPAERRRGVGAALLRAVEAEVRNRGGRRLEVVYMTMPDTGDAVERLLRRFAWSEPEGRMLVCRSDTTRIAPARWAKGIELPAEFRRVPWTAVTAEQKERLRRSQEARPWIPPDLVPFDHESGMEPRTSFALLRGDDIVGWMIMHALADDLARFTCSYVHPDLQRRALALALYAEAIRVAQSVGLTRGIWTVPFEHTAMVRFTRRRMAPFLSSLQDTRGAYKDLTVPEAP